MQNKPAMKIFQVMLLAGMVTALLNGCATAPPKETPAKLVTQPAKFADLPGWQDDNLLAAYPAFAKSCARILKVSPDKKFFSEDWAGSLAQWQQKCASLPAQANLDARALRQWFEMNFTPVLATVDGKAEGLFTGYYEASLRGSKVRTGAYQIPIRARPDDLVMVNLGEFRDELKGQRIAGRVIDGSLKPYEERAQIEDGKLPPQQDKPLFWVDNAAAAFFLEIQGSGVIELTDGTQVRVGFDGQNGHPYYAIGKELVKRGHLSKDNVTMQSIKAWLDANPVEGREIMRTNRSYVFFKVQDKDGAVGGEGLILTPGRSLAIDRSLIPYGLPVYLDADLGQAGKLRQLMVAQDTGGAIRGPVRGDVFWGFGPQAEIMAGPMKAPGRYWFLVPKP